MEFSSGQYTQLIAALFAGVVIFTLAYTARVKYVIAFLVLTVPFQFVASRYGTINMVLIYLATIALIFRREVRVWPLLWSVILIYFAYVASMFFTLRATWFDHVLYLIAVGSNFALFYIVYNYVRRTPDSRFVVNLLIGVALLANLHFLLSLILGFNQVAILGINEWELGRNLEEKQRLVGPFNAAGTNAEFLALQIPLLGYLFMRERKTWKRWLLFILINASFGFLVATGSRGGFLAMVGGVGLFVFAFRRDLGVRGVLLAVGSGLSLAVVAVLVVQLTAFNVLFDRLGKTEFEGFTPDTRQSAFAITLERIPENWIIGHGPRVKLIDQENRRIRGYVPLGGYPHNLYLFLLYSVGILGLMAYLIWFGALGWRFWRARRRRDDDQVAMGIPRLALVLLAVFLVSQYRIEFLRDVLHDHQNYMFALWAMLLALSDRLGRTQREPTGADGVAATPAGSPYLVGAKPRQSPAMTRRQVGHKLVGRG